MLNKLLLLKLLYSLKINSSNCNNILLYKNNIITKKCLKNQNINFFINYNYYKKILIKNKINNNYIILWKCAISQFFINFEYNKNIKNNKITLNKKFYKNNFTKLFLVYFIYFLKFFLKKNIIFKAYNLKFLKYSHKIIYLNIFKKLKKFKRFAGGYKKLLKISKILFFAILLKDATILSKVFSYYMEKVHFRRHKKLIKIFRKIMIIYYRNIGKLIQFKGLYFNISGKISVAGDSKTRTKRWKFGTFNSSSKFGKFSYSLFRVRTKTGVLGAKLLISYE